MTTIENQDQFDQTIGRLDRILSVLVNCGRYSKARNEWAASSTTPVPHFDDNWSIMDKENQQTLKHHAEDMIAAGQKILKDLGTVEGTPQPEKK